MVVLENIFFLGSNSKGCFAALPNSPPQLFLFICLEFYTENRWCRWFRNRRNAYRSNIVLIKAVQFCCKQGHFVSPKSFLPFSIPSAAIIQFGKLQQETKSIFFSNKNHFFSCYVDKHSSHMKNTFNWLALANEDFNLSRPSTISLHSFSSSDPQRQILPPRKSFPHS